MNPLDFPVDDNGKAYVAADVFELCISNAKVKDLKRRLHDLRDDVEQQASTYESLANDTRLHEVTRKKEWGSVSYEELKDVYTSRMLADGNQGRLVYDRIRSAPKLKLCPLCGLNDVSSLDHHLPKSEYPILCVTPNNLVPACDYCQDSKKEQAPTAWEDQTLHPYFDKFQFDVWLKADIVEISPPAFRYSVDENALDEPTRKRLNRHLAVFNLRERFAVQAARALSTIRGYLQELYEAGGAATVKSHLAMMARSSERHCKNSWETAMYRAAAANDWFCDGGYGASPRARAV